MKKTKVGTAQFVICIDNSDYPASLELHKVYQALPDERAAQDSFLRVIDESGGDYLYSADRFVALELPRLVEQSVLCHIKGSPPPHTQMRQSRLSRAPRPSTSPTRKKRRALTPVH